MSLFSCLQRSNGVTVVSLGDYDTEVQAARAYDIAEIFFKRDQPNGLNFPVEDYKADIDFIVGK